MDPAFVSWGLPPTGFDTVRIAIGDNLLRKPCVTEPMKLGKVSSSSAPNRGRGR